ncbi:hypothetical protein FRC10_009069 [Ceratobasidium sp. 414]|nr:hypothetical protein FRC10_009069 [Ceratobasidium sp. 414]
MDTTHPPVLDAPIVTPQLPPWVFQDPALVDLEGTPTKDQLILAIRVVTKAVAGLASDRSYAPDFAADIFFIPSTLYSMDLVDRIVAEGRKALDEKFAGLDRKLDEVRDQVEGTNRDLGELKEAVEGMGHDLSKLTGELKQARKEIEHVASGLTSRFKTLDSKITRLSADRLRDLVETQKWIPVQNVNGELPTELPALRGEVDIWKLDRFGRIAYINFYGLDPRMEATDVELKEQLQMFLTGL